MIETLSGPTKECTRCHRALPLSAFSPRAEGRLKLHSRCRECCVERTRLYKQSLPKEVLAAQARKHRLKGAFGITADDYDRMADQQHGLCLGCLRPETSIYPKSGNAFRLAVHHDHVSGKVICLLCARCNVASGMVGDDPDILLRLVRIARGEI